MADTQPLSYAYVINPNTGQPAYVYAGTGGFNGSGFQPISFQEAQQAVKGGLNYMPGGNMTNAQFLALGAPSDSGMVASWTNPKTGEVLTNVPQTTIDSIMGQNSASSPKTLGDVTGGSSSPMSTPQNMNYTIKSGDTLSKIAANNGTTVQALQAANPQITNPNLIIAGQSLTIPSSTSQNQQTAQNQQTQNQSTQQNQQTPTPTPTQQSSFSAVTGYQTGNAQLDAIVAGLQTTLNQMIASGQVINPNIALSPSDITTFLNQAKGIIDPYFSSQISQIQEGLSQNLTSLQQQWDNEQQADQLAFQQSLSQTREANAGAGTALSGGRSLQELQATQGAQNQINQQQNALQGQAQLAVNNAAQQIGSSSTNTLPFNTYAASNQGLGSVNQSGQLSYSPINVTQGSLEAAQQTAESTQATQLASQALQSRALGFYPSTT